MLYFLQNVLRKGIARKGRKSRCRASVTHTTASLSECSVLMSSASDIPAGLKHMNTRKRTPGSSRTHFAVLICELQLWKRTEQAVNETIHGSQYIAARRSGQRLDVILLERLQVRQQ